METKDYLAQESYPLSTQSLDFIQNQILFTQKIGALLGGGAWLIKEATQNDKGLVFVNTNGYCELMELELENTGANHYWICESINNTTKTWIKLSSKVDPDDDPLFVFELGEVKKVDNIFEPKLLTRTYMNNLKITKDLRTKLVTIQGTWQIMAQGYNTITIDNAFAPSQSIAIWATDSISNASKGAMVGALGETQENRTLIMLPYVNTGYIQLNGSYYAAN